MNRLARLVALFLPFSQLLAESGPRFTHYWVSPPRPSLGIFSPP